MSAGRIWPGTTWYVRIEVSSAASVLSTSIVAGSIFANASSTGAKTVNSSPLSVSTRLTSGFSSTRDRGGQGGEDRVVRRGGGHRVLRHAGNRACAVRDGLGVTGAAGTDEVGRGVHLRLRAPSSLRRPAGRWSLRSWSSRSTWANMRSVRWLRRMPGVRADTASCGTSCPPRFRDAGAVSQCQWCCGHSKRPTRCLRRPRRIGWDIPRISSDAASQMRLSTIASRALARAVLGHAG